MPRVVGFQRSEYPTFSNVLLHVNGAHIKALKETSQAAELIFGESDKNLNFSVIDGQHRVNGAYFAVQLQREIATHAVWDIAAEIFIDLDQPDAPPRHQAQIFIDVNFYQKKVDRSLVADLFPTARGRREALDDKERAQDLGRKLMLETGPLVGMIQIPGIRYGVKDVVTLATLNAAIEDVIPAMMAHDIVGLDEQAEFLAQCLDCWLVATGRKEDVGTGQALDSGSVVYQGRVLVSFLTLVPAGIWFLKKKGMSLISDEAHETLTKWIHDVVGRAGLLDKGQFISKSQFKELGFLGSGGIARFRNTLWAAARSRESVAKLEADELAEKAAANREEIFTELDKYGNQQ